MTDARDTGGPAYPVDELCNRDGSVVAQNFGVTIRDYFAAEAMQGMLSADSSMRNAYQRAPSDQRTNGEIGAQLAYGWADAMLKARQQ